MLQHISGICLDYYHIYIYIYVYYVCIHGVFPLLLLFHPVCTYITCYGLYFVMSSVLYILYVMGRIFNYFLSMLLPPESINMIFTSYVDLTGYYLHISEEV